MDPHLRDAWTHIVDADDLDAHMAAVGQAQANAALVRTMVEAGPAPSRASMLVAGAGTGQMFDFVGPAFLAPFRVTFSDLNGGFLARLRARLAGSDLVFDTIVDDIESPRLAGPFGAAIVVLVLEHVEWRRALDGLAGLDTEVLHLLVQRNPPDMETAITPGRALPPSLLRASEKAHPTLIDPAEIEAHLAGHGYEVASRREQPVQDGKTMIGLTLVRRAS
jgi:hypothetical protein